MISRSNASFFFQFTVIAAVVNHQFPIDIQQAAIIRKGIKPVHPVFRYAQVAGKLERKPVGPFFNAFVS